MNNYNLDIFLPLDDDGFFRRECPLCLKEFKIYIEKEELNNLTQKGIDTFLVYDEAEDEKDLRDEKEVEELICPYCGQNSSKHSFWTQEQAAYIKDFAENITIEIITKNLIQPLKRNSQQSSFIKFEGKELQQKEPWISPEENDMKIFELPCCQRKIKVQENWDKSIYCIFCGFPYRAKTL